MPSSGKFKAVLFDLGGTLIKTLDVPEIYRRILEAYGVRVSVDVIAEAHKQNEEEFDVEEMVKLGQDFWIGWNLRVLNRLSLKKNSEFLARKIDELWWEYAELEAHQDVMETLAGLKTRKAKTGVVTNALERECKKILQKLTLTDYFDVMVGVDACNKAKPDSAIFLYALNKLDTHPREAIFVGDSLEKDYEGAKKAGLKALLVDRERKAFTSVKSIKSLTEVLQYFQPSS